MQVIENTDSFINLPRNQSDSIPERYSPGFLTAEKSDNQTGYGYARKMGADRSCLLKLRFSKIQILLIIFESNFNFPSFFISFVNPYRIIKKPVAYECVEDNFSVL